MRHNLLTDRHRLCRPLWSRPNEQMFDINDTDGWFGSCEVFHWRGVCESLITSFLCLLYQGGATLK